ncbi:nuclear transport factor 2 family protein [Microbacterium sp. DT81.1]|uniref:nuclear transport factor 2 family protein n=1 Tax=Microbacterium sp. DT81.1 TaxID=3393413 RepID=UPI003CF12498
MSTEQTKQTMDRYFTLMGSEGDFAQCYAADVTWLVADTGEIVRGPQTVRNYVVTLHARLTDMQTLNFVVADDHSYLEGDCSAGRSRADERIHYCVAYDIDGGLITAMRCYGLGAPPTP